MTNIKIRKPKISFSPEQRLDYAKLMVNEGYSNKLFQLSVSTHYYHLNQEVSDSEQFMINKIKEIATEHRHAYGKRRMKKELNNKGR
jgi:hypothetical protein